MKRFVLFLSIVCFVVLSTSCPYYSFSKHEIPEREKKAIIYLHVLKEDGKPFEDSFSKDFILDYYKNENYDGTKIVINEKDELIFKCSTFYAYYESKEPTEYEMKKALDDGYWFALKDTKGVYKTVKKTYKETYKSYEKTPNPDNSYSQPTYIVHCEIKLEKKQP